MGSEVQILPGPPIRLDRCRDPWSGTAPGGAKPGDGCWAMGPGDDEFGNPGLRDEAGSSVGGVAQLGEHLLCKQGVIGSIPIVSTT